MPDIQTVRSWEGRAMVDGDGDRIGTIDAIYVDDQTGEPEWALVNTGLFGTKGTVASGVQSNRRPPPESLNAIGDARIDCFEHFWQSSGREAAPLCYPPTAPSGQMQQCLGRSSPSTQTIIRLVRVVCDETASREDGP